MNALEVFKDYLLKQKTSKVTVKNYLSDIRKFIYWYENKYKETFHPLLINESVVKSFIDQPNEPENVLSVRSVKRYSSSLKKFFSLLTELGAIPGNPFVISPKSSKETDPWHLKEFRDYLYVSKIGSLTMKNYIMDINQFLLWLEKVSEETTGLSFEKKSEANQDIFSHIDNFSLQEYKNRLLHERQLSPVSINRKLSSLRRYTSWLASNEVIKKDIYVSDLSDKVLTKLVPAQIDEPASEDIQDLKELASVLPLAEKKSTPRSELLGTSSGYIAHHGETQSLPAIPSYSKFPPLRLLQKSKRAVIGLIDVLIILQAVRAIESTKYLLWAVKGKKIFAPTSKIIDPSFNEQPAMKIETTKLNKLQLLLAKLPKFSSLPIPNVTNFPKSMYAPLKLSTKHLPLHKRVIFHLRQTRPQWYKKYHSYPVVHYFHFAIFIIFATTIGLSTYRAFVEAPGSDKPVFAALPTAPPRILSFQGRLTDSTGTPITSATDLRFGIYNSPSASGSALLWEEVQKVTTNEDGVFATLLGKKSLISQALFANNSSLYLGIAVAKDAELKPRQQLATVAYASNAETLQGLAPITQANAGTANVILALDSSGNLTIGGSSTPKFEATGGEFTLSGRILTLKTTAGSNANVKIAPDGSGIVDIQKPIQNTTSNSSANGVAGAVEIGDLLSVVVSSSSQSAFTINQISTGSLINAQVDGAARFTVSNGGAGTFASDLTVNGSNFTSSASTFNLLTTPTTIYIGSSAATLTLGASSGTTTVGNALNVSGLATFNGSAVVPSGKTLTVSGNVASDLLPSASDTYSLGAGNNFWKNGYFTNLFMASTATTSGFWQRNNGAVAPANTSDDLLIGANTASSATFGISASTGNATTSGSLTFNTNGVIQTTKAQTLTLGGSTTGNIVIDSGSNVLELADNTISLTGSAPVISTSTTNAALELKANGIGTLTFNNGATGNIQFFSNSNTVSSGGNLTLAGNISLTGSNPSISTSSTNRLDLTANSATLSIGGTSGSVGIGTTSPLATLDVNGTASISGALKLYGTPIIQTTANQTLVLGGDTTGNITLSPLNGVLGAYVAPSTNNQIDIGTSFLAFKTIYVNNVIPGSIGIQGYLQRNSGALSPTNITDDLLLGSTATSSAKFAFLNVAGGTPTASISANSGDNATTLSGLGVLGTTNKQTLTLGNSSTGEVILAPGGTTALTARGANLIGAGTFTSTGLITANAGLTVASAQNVTLTGFSQGSVLYTNGSAVIAQATGTSSQLLHGGTTPAFGAVALASEVSGILPTANGGSWWNSTNGAIYTGNQTLDLLIGGTASTSATFHAYGAGPFQGTNASASVSARSSFASFVIDQSGVGDIFTASKSGQTKFVVKNNGDIGLDANQSIDTLTAGSLSIGNTTANALTLGRSGVTTTFGSTAWTATPTISGLITATSGLTSNGTLTVANGQTFAANGVVTIGDGGDTVAINSSDWDINATGDMTGIGAVTADGAITFSNLTAGGFVKAAGGTGLLSVSSTINLASEVSGILPTANGGSKWDINSGAISTGNQTLDLLIGGTSSTSATFRITGNSPFRGTTSAASVSANTSFAGFVIDNKGVGDIFTASTGGVPKFTINNSGSITSSNYQLNGGILYADSTGLFKQIAVGTSSQLLHGGTTPAFGAVALASEVSGILPTANGGSKWDINAGAISTGNQTLDLLIGGTASSSANFRVTGNSPFAGTLSAASVSANTSFAGFVVDNRGVGDLFTASKSGNTKFVIVNSGSVGIGTAMPGALLDVTGSGVDGVSPPSIYISNTSNGSGWTADATVGQLGFYSADASALGPTVRSSIQMYTDNTAGSIYGLRFLTDNGGLVEKMRINPAGNVGIGDTTPTEAKLVVGASGTGDIYATFGTAHSYTKALCGVGSGATLIEDCVGSAVADYAELYATSQDVDYGDVVTIGDRTVNIKALNGTGEILEDGSTIQEKELVKSATPYDRKVIGIASNNYGDFTSTGHRRIDPADHPRPVALNGRVPVKIAANSAAISAGDFVTTSSIAGRAMKATRAGQVIGKALEDWTPGSGKDQILVFVNISQYDPHVYLSDTGDITITDGGNGSFAIADPTEDIRRVGIFSDAAIANLKAGKIDVHSLLVNGTDVADLINTATSSASGSASLTDLNSLSATVSALQTQNTNHGIQLNSLESRVGSLESGFASLASSSAFLQDMVTNALSTFSASSSAQLGLDKLDVHEATVSGTLDVLGRATFNNVGITGTVSVGLLAINGLNDPSAGSGQVFASIDTTAQPLHLQSHGLFGLDILDGKVTIAANGDMNVDGAITVKKVNIDTSDVAGASLGTGTIVVGQSSVVIHTTAVGSASKVFLTPITDVDAPLYISAQSANTSFTVKMSTPATSTVKFNWWVVN